MPRRLVTGNLPAAVVAAVIVVAGCTATPAGPPAAAPTTDATAVEATELPTDTRSVPYPLPDGEPGDPIAVSPRSGGDVPPGARAWDLLYLSEGVGAQPVAVSGVLYAPGGPAPHDGRPVLSWAHGTTGVADRCAPSRAGVDVPGLSALLDAGYVVTATDYEGLGTPGPHPYLVGASEGRSVLDAARAAARIEGTGAGLQVVVAGHSQGGQAALFAGRLAPDHAPELDLLGVVASAPVAELRTLLRGAVPISLAFGLVASAVQAYSEAYDELELDEVLTPAALDRIGVVEEACLGEVSLTFLDRPTSAWLVVNPFELEAWARRAEENEPGSAAISAPVLVVQGSADVVVPALTTDRAVARLCEGGNTVDYRLFSGADHSGVVAEAAGEIRAWVEERVAGSPAASTCSTGARPRASS